MSTDEFLVLGRDLTALARAGKLDPVVGRDKELEEVLRILCRRNKSNPLLLGEPGVGKTALVEGLAQAIVSGAVPGNLRSRPLFELRLGSMLAGTQFRGDLEKRLQSFIEEAKRKKMIVFIDEIHLLVLAGRGSGMDAANLLKPILARGEMPCIGATTPKEAEEMFRTDSAMERRFQSVILAEPDLESVKLILKAIRPGLEAHHGISIGDDAIAAAVEVSARLAPNSSRRNPDLALDVLEDTCAAEQLRLARQAVRQTDEDREIRSLEEQLKRALEELDLDRHVKIREQISELKGKLIGESETILKNNTALSADHVYARHPTAQQVVQAT